MATKKASLLIKKTDRRKAGATLLDMDSDDKVFIMLVLIAGNNISDTKKIKLI